LAAIAGVTWRNFYFRLFLGAILSSQIVQFLKHLLRHLDCELLAVPDGSCTHRSCLLWDSVRQRQVRLWPDFLPVYASELNYLDWKHLELPNFCPRIYWQLSGCARQSHRRAPTYPSNRLPVQCQLF
jgi:transposase